MFSSHPHHDTPHRENAPGGWGHSRLSFDAIMSALVAMIVVWVAAILFLPIWAR